MSTFGETLAAHTRRLTEDDRNRQREGRGDNHNDTANKTDPNRSLNRDGGAPGRNKRSHGDREWRVGQTTPDVQCLAPIPLL